MSSRRQEQVAEFLRDEVSEIITREMKDPRLGFVSITRVELSPDLRYAKVFISVFGSEEEREATLRALTGAAGFVRYQLKPRMRIRHIPEISFQLDRSMEHAEEVARTLNKIRRRNPSSAGEPPDEPRGEGADDGHE
ncbi:30S ribosome-binding factor RbfA [Nitrolancea hollandica]|nr:30S ribosome-binding factor RbfA [Nitrolancea hollandica]